MSRPPLIDRLGIRERLAHLGVDLHATDRIVFEGMHALLDRVEAIERILGITPGECVFQVLFGATRCLVHDCEAVRDDADTMWVCDSGGGGR